MTTLYLSHLALDLMQRQVQRDLADCYAMHQRMLSPFPDGLTGGHPREQLGLLYRIEQSRQQPTALVQSRAVPNWSRLPASYLAQPPAVKRIDPLYDALTVGTPLVFRLRANPTRRISERNATQAERWRGKRIDLRREEDQLAWLSHKAERAGFTLLVVRARRDVSDVRVTTSATAHGNPVGTGRLTFGSVVFDGRLRVTDPDAFRATLATGIGSGKAFGFGLLSIAPIAAPHDN